MKYKQVKYLNLQKKTVNALGCSVQRPFDENIFDDTTDRSIAPRIDFHAMEPSQKKKNQVQWRHSLLTQLNCFIHLIWNIKKWVRAQDLVSSLLVLVDTIPYVDLLWLLWWFISVLLSYYLQVGASGVSFARFDFVSAVETIQRGFGYVNTPSFNVKSNQNQNQKKKWNINTKTNWLKLG